MKRFPVLAVAVLAAASIGLAGADTMIVQKTHTDAMPMMNQPAKDETKTTWLAKDRLRVTGGDADVLVRTDQKKLYMLFPDKTAMSVDLPVDVAKIVPEQVRPMLDMMKMTAKVTPTDEKKKIGAFDARKFLVEISNAQMKISQVVWAAKDVKVDYALYQDLVGVTQSISPGMAEAMAEFRKIEGFPVLTEMTMEVMGTKIGVREELVSIEEKPAPPGTYEIPAGYAVEPLDLMKMQMKKQS